MSKNDNNEQIESQLANMPEEYWKEKLSPTAYSITRCADTERPFAGPHLQEKRDGSYYCICCGAILFESIAKFDSGTGWPSFFEKSPESAIAEKQDYSHGMARSEIICDNCKAHIGHVFDDGPKPTGKRYCTNGHALDFKAK